MPIESGLRFGAAANIVVQTLRYQNKSLHYAYLRHRGAGFRLENGAEWVGGSDAMPRKNLTLPSFTPIGALIPAALRAIRPGGTVVCGGIHMSDIPSFPYDLLWREKRLVSVANLTRQDAEEFLGLAPKKTNQGNYGVHAAKPCKHRSGKAARRATDGCDYTDTRSLSLPSISCVTFLM